MQEIKLKSYLVHENNEPEKFIFFWGPMVKVSKQETILFCVTTKLKLDF